MARKLWQDRTGLTRAVDAAKALGVTRQAIDLLRKGERDPSGPMRRLMALIEAHPEITAPPPP